MPKERSIKNVVSEPKAKVAAKPATSEKAGAIGPWASAAAGHFIGELDRISSLVRVGMTEVELIVTVGGEPSQTGTFLSRARALPKPPDWSGDDRWLEPALGLRRIRRKGAWLYDGSLYLEWNQTDCSALSPQDCAGVLVAVESLMRPRCGPGVFARAALTKLSFPQATTPKVSAHSGVAYDTAQFLVQFDWQ